MKDFEIETMGEWQWDSRGSYITFKPDGSQPYFTAVTRQDENTVVLHLPVKGYFDNSVTAFRPLVFNKRTGT